MNPLKPAVSIHIFPPNRCATGCSICGLSDLPSSTSKILRTQEWLIKAIKVTRYRPLYILFSLYLCLFLLFLILPSYTFFEDMTVLQSHCCDSANHHESPEVIEFNKWRGFGHISMDQKGTVPGVSWIKVDGFTRPKWVFLPFSGCFLDMLQQKKKQPERYQEDQLGSMMRFCLVSNEFIAAPRSCLPKLFFGIFKLHFRFLCPLPQNGEEFFKIVFVVALWPDVFTNGPLIRTKSSCTGKKFRLMTGSLACSKDCRCLAKEGVERSTKLTWLVAESSTRKDI